MNIVSVSSSNWLCLSSVYSYDDNISLYTIPIISLDGYTGVLQHIYINSFDDVINRETIFHLPTGMELMDFMYDTGKPVVKTGGYTTITTTISGVEYYLAVGDSTGSYLKLSTDENDGILIRVDVNDDNTLSFYYGINKLITVSETEPLLLYIDTPLIETEKYRQKFNYEAFGNDQLTISTVAPLPSRYWAYRTIGPYSYVVRVNGYITDDATTNNYLFTIPGVEDVIKYNPKGLVVGHNWVTYYNDISGKENNKNVNIKDKREIRVQHLIDNPYHTSETTDKSTMINIANLKSIMTETYNYKE